MTTNVPVKFQNSLFTDFFSSLKEPRRTFKGNFQYPLEEILFLNISAFISGFFEWKEVVCFGESKIDWLRKFFPFQNGIPSHDVINRVFNRLDTKEFNSCFMEWVNSISAITQGRIIAFDGKTICGNASNLGGSKLHIVSAFCANNGISLGQKKVSEKTNEILAIPELLNLIAVKGCIVTIDAMGCQKEIAKKIIEKQADYILMVKDNQASLKEQIEKVFKIQKPDYIAQNDDLGHGRIETRTCEMITRLDFLDEKENWTGIKSILRVLSERTNKKTNVSSRETRYYISSIPKNAELLNNSIRSHWSIENNLHWTLDVIMKEDGQRNYIGNAAENVNMMKKIALGMLTKETSLKESKNLKMKKALLNDRYRELLMNL